MSMSFFWDTHVCAHTSTPHFECRNCSTPTATVQNFKREFVFEKIVLILISSLIIQKSSGKAFLRSMRLHNVFLKSFILSKYKKCKSQILSYWLVADMQQSKEICGRYASRVSNPNQAHHKGWILNLNTTFWRYSPFWLWIPVKNDSISKILQLLYLVIQHLYKTCIYMNSIWFYELTLIYFI